MLYIIKHVLSDYPRDQEKRKKAATSFTQTVLEAMRIFKVVCSNSVAFGGEP